MNTFNFIEEYKIPKKICDGLIAYHKKNKEYKREGETHGGVDKTIKDSTDVLFYNDTNNKVIRDLFLSLTDCVNSYVKKYNFMQSHVVHTFMLNIIQHYKKGGGYKVTHYERADRHTANRQLVYMVYLNTLKNGGTHFPYQNKTLNAVKGKLVIWPSDFTHPHVGVISNDEEKYIATGWFEIV